MRVLQVTGAVDEHHRRRGRVAFRADHLGREHPRVDLDAVARLVRHELRLDPLERPPFLAGRCRHLRRGGARLVRHDVHLVRLGARGIDQTECAVVGRRFTRGAADHRRQLRALAAIDRHRVDVPFAGMGFGARDVELRPVRGQLDIVDFPMPLCELPRRRLRRGCIHGVEMHPAVALGKKPDTLLIQQQPVRGIHRTESANFTDPRVVVKPVQHAGFAALGIHRHQPAILVVGCAHMRDRERAIVGQERHAPPHRSLGVLRILRVLGVGGILRILGALGVGTIDRRGHRFAGVDVQDRERPVVLGISDERTSRDVFGVARLGDVVRHVGTLRGIRALDNEQEDVFAVGRQLQVVRRLTIGELVLRQRVRLVFFFGLLLLLCLQARVLDQLRLFGLDELLTVGVAGIALAGLNVSELGDLPAVERHDEQVVVACEGDGRLPAGPARVRFGAGGPGDLAASAGDRIEQDDVAPIDKQHPAMGLVPPAIDGRRALAFFVIQLPWRSAVSRDHPCRRLVVVGLAPFEVEPRGIARPAKPGRRVTDQFRPAHDAVDREFEPSRGRLGLGGGRGTGQSRRRCDKGQRGEPGRGADRNVHRKVYN